MARKTIVTIDRAAGTATMHTGSWSETFPAGDLAKKLRFYRRLWARKAKAGGHTSDDKTPGPWAGHYEDDVRALERAVREWMA